MMQTEIIAPPIGNIYGRIAIIEGKRGSIRYYRRAAIANVFDRLNHTLQDCAMEISKAKFIYDLQGAGRVRTMSLTKSNGRGLEDWTHSQIDIKQRYDDWLIALKSCPRTVGICKRFCQDEQSIDEIRKHYRISERRALWGLIWGLNEYSIRAGWGNQIDG